MTGVAAVARTAVAVDVCGSSKVASGVAHTVKSRDKPQGLIPEIQSRTQKMKIQLYSSILVEIITCKLGLLLPSI